MRSFMMFEIPLLLTLLAPCLMLWLLWARVAGKIHVPMVASIFLCTGLGVALSSAGSFISLAHLPPSIHCGTGCMVFMVLGSLLSLTFNPVAGAIAYLIYRGKRSKVAQAFSSSDSQAGTTLQ